MDTLIKTFAGLLIVTFSSYGSADQMTERLKGIAFKNPLVNQIIAQTAAEASMKPEDCKITVLSASGEDTNTGLDGEITLAVSCTNSKIEFGRYGRISGDVNSDIYFISAVKLDSAG